MGEELEHFDVRRIDAHGSDYMAALHLVMDVALPDMGGPNPQVADLLVTEREGHVSLDLLFGVYRRNRLLTACVAVVAKGGAASVLLPQRPNAASDEAALRAALETLHDTVWGHGVRLLEALILPEAVVTGRVLRRAGFRRLTRLVYLTRRMGEPLPVERLADGLSWVTFDPSREAVFREALVATYAQSLDCPELTGLRGPSDVLATHRARRGFDPALWWVALRDREPVGLMLCNRVPPEPAVEIVYVGVAQPSRGTGVAGALLKRAIGAARSDGATYMALAVDERNTPARRMYARWGFTEALVRDALIATPVAT